VVRQRLDATAWARRANRLGLQQSCRLPQHAAEPAAELAEGFEYAIKEEEIGGPARPGWRQLPWPVDDNYPGRLKADAGQVREAGLA
jgi:hypothetical protein